MTAIEVPPAVPTPTAKTSLMRRLVRRPVSLASLIFLLLVVVVAVIGRWIAPFDPNVASLKLVLAAPSAAHPLGADSAGRDVLSRLLAATQITLAAALVAVVTALVIGVGGLGHLGVQLLKAISSARVVAVDGRDDAREHARTLGADLAVAPDDEAAARVRAATIDGRGVDVVLDFVGSDETLALAAEVVRQVGDLTIVGIAGGTLPVSFFGIPYETSVQTTYWGNRRELVEVLDLAARGLIHAESSIYTLDDALDAYRDLEHGNVRGRAVVVPNDAFTG